MAESISKGGSLVEQINRGRLCLKGSYVGAVHLREPALCYLTLSMKIRTLRRRGQTVTTKQGRTTRLSGDMCWLALYF